jgi:omega-6 fatty acid desaturase (delta-12 desaturase)
MSSPEDISQLGPSNLYAALITVGLAATTGLALWLSLQSNLWVWGIGQLGLSLCLVQWFVVLHECGHRTLFKAQRINVLVGNLAGVLAVFPFFTWRSIHHQHHRWTGWQDKDPTTAVLVPDDLHPIVRMVMNFCWRANLPLFALIYRVNNYWNLPRLWTMFPRANHRRRHAINIVAQLGLYASILVWVGPWPLLRAVGLAYLLMNIMLDVILLSQHSHIPMRVSDGESVVPFSFAEQVPFTRSLRFPDWVSRVWLFGFDLHELHHEFPSVSGYRLPNMYRPMPNEVSWWRWALQAKSTPADIFLFSNREKSGLSL